MPSLDFETEMLALLAELQAGDLAESGIRAHAMIGAATAFLARVSGHDAVAAQLRADADIVASYKPAPGEPPTPSAALN